MINFNSKIYIAGHNGMVGSACWRALESKGYKNLIGYSSKELDLRDQRAVFNMLEREKPEAIIDAAAKVGGILANSNYPYEFLMDNMLIQNNLIKAANELNIPKFIFLGSSCIYPKLAPQPLKEEYLLNGPLEETNQWYAIAKISGVKLIEAIRQQYNRDYVSLMPTNLFGPGDNYDLKSSHVIPAMLRKFSEANENDHSPVELWGTGTPKREFIHVDDLANAVVFTLENKLKESLYNVGSEIEISIKKLADLIQNVTGHKGEIIWNQNKPDGTPRKLMDSSKLHQLGWSSMIDLKTGIKEVYNNYINGVK
ncbi:GDP-L-fucose synthase [Flavobacteriaceae bacterium]|nr:GDP-L-fucose synthase [Flavobacteriaceae bacterium]MDB2491578.1 GDP-L-fucose synthase [Flavobacteriaceae bacterium]MDB4281284.1 GDP-L-fucose synthase [Flavobacteriaceae bacterium]